MSIDSSDFHVVALWGGIKKPPLGGLLNGFIMTQLLKVL